MAGPSDAQHPPADRLKEARAVWSGTGISSTTLVANSLTGKVLLTCGCSAGQQLRVVKTGLKTRADRAAPAAAAAAAAEAAHLDSHI